MIYISLVGTQAMAVVNPILAMESAGYRWSHIVLLATEKSYATAKRIHDFLISREENPPHVEICTVSGSTMDSHPSAQEIIPRFSDYEAQKFFNLGGGMNYQISMCVAALSLEEFALVYPGMDKVMLFRPPAGQPETFPIPELPIQKIVRLQGIRAKFEKQGTRPQLLFKILERCLLNHPRWFPNVRIGDVVFDYIWSTKNTLHFLVVLDSATIPQDQIKETTRRYIDIAAGRNEFSELFHRKILVITNDDRVFHRINEEADGKIEVIQAYGGITDNVCRCLSRFFSGPSRLAGEGTEEILATGKRLQNDGLLLTCLGKNPLPSYIALWSARPSKCCFFYTPGDIEVERIVKAIKKNKQLLPAEQIRLYPISPDGHEILQFPAPENIEKTMVNTTPGTKVQGALLSVWAHLHETQGYTHETRSDQIRSFTGTEHYPALAPNPADLLTLKGKALKKAGEYKASLLTDSPKQESIVRFLRMVHHQNTPLQKFPKGNPLQLDGARYRYDYRYDRGQISFDDGHSVELQLASGKWFERLVGYVVLLAGADDVQVGIEIDWPEKLRKKFEELYGDSHMSEFDVVARFGSKFLLVSCKAMGPHDPKANVPLTVDEAKEQAKIFGRFSMPLVCFLRKEDPADIVKNVTVLGYKDLLLDSGSFRKFIDSEFERHRNPRL